MNYRLYTFVANHYISPLQCGLQTAHVVSELSRYKQNTHQAHIFNAWAENDKTIIICGAGNHKGVMDCHAELVRTGGGALLLPVALFREDEQSMNGMATACGVIVPEQYYDVQFFPETTTFDEQRLVVERVGAYWEYFKPGYITSTTKHYQLTHPEGQFINHIKGYRLA
jgi:hypothetical protein